MSNRNMNANDQMMMSGRGGGNNMQANMYGNYYEPDCCGCFPLECGVRTLFFLTFVGTIGTIVNIIIGVVAGRYFALFQLLMLPAAIFTLFYVMQWSQSDNFYNRRKISQGFRCMFIVNIIANLVILFLVIFAINEFWDSQEFQEAVDMYYNNMYGTDYNSSQAQALQGLPNVDQFQQVGVNQPYYPNQPAYYNYGQNYYNPGQAYYARLQNPYNNQLNYGYYGPYQQNYYNQGYYYNYPAQLQQYNRQQQQKQAEDWEDVKETVILMWALVYGGFIIITGFITFYWYTVIKRWASMAMSQVQPYGGDGMGGQDLRLSSRSPQAKQQEQASIDQN